MSHKTEKTTCTDPDFPVNLDPLPPYLRRMVIEYVDLREKRIAAWRVLRGDNFPSDKLISEYHRDLGMSRRDVVDLELQLKHMDDYSHVLGRRITNSYLKTMAADFFKILTS